MKKITLALLLLSTSVLSHPVIYKGGWVYQGSFMPKMNNMRVGYSASSKYSLVANANHFENIDNYQDYTFGINYLFKRWLNLHSQANIYGGLHGGYFKDDNTDGEVGHTFLMGDWESREHYVMFKTDAYFYDNREQFSYIGRYGFAPFIAGMDELQTWMIVQALYYEEQSKEVIITPMIRFFYKNVLWEVGYSTRGQSYLTLMVHY